MCPGDVQATAALPLHRACVGARRSAAQVVPSVVRTRSRTWVVRPRRDAQPLDDVDAEQHWVAARFCGRVHSSVVGVSLVQIRVCPLHGAARTHMQADHIKRTASKQRRVWRASRRDGFSQNWTHRGLNPGPSACGADVIPLHHVPRRGCCSALHWACS